MSAARVWSWRGVAASGLVRPRALVWLALLLAALCAVGLLSLMLGESMLPWRRALAALFGYGDAFEQLLVQTLRLPRVALALLAGSALALAGYLLQSLSRVSLASPDLLGVVDGAAVGVTAFLVLFTETHSNTLPLSVAWLPLAALLGALLAFTLVYLLCLRRSVSAERLVLTGIAVTALGKALVALLMSVGLIFSASKAQLWLTGTVNQTNASEVALLAPLLLPLLLLALLQYRQLALQQLDAAASAGLGLDGTRQALLLAALSSALSALAVAYAGAIGFVGLMAPHWARRLIPHGVLLQMLACLLLGALLVLSADLLGRTVAAPYEIPAGVVTAVLGVPYLLLMLRRRSA
jgi:iron complex transport system permease protein